MLWSQELHTVLKVWLHQCWVYWDNHLFWLVSYIVLNAPHDTIGLFGHQGTRVPYHHLKPPDPCLQGCAPAPCPEMCMYIQDYTAVEEGIFSPFFFFFFSSSFFLYCWSAESFCLLRSVGLATHEPLLLISVQASGVNQCLQMELFRQREVVEEMFPWEVGESGDKWLAASLEQ